MIDHESADRASIDRPLTDRVDELSLSAKVGQLFQVGIPGRTRSDTARELVGDYGVGGVVYFDRNVGTPPQLAQLSRQLQETATTTGIPLLLSVDQEGGAVTRIPFGTEPPGGMALGATGDPKLAREFGAAVGEQLRSVGVTANFAPVLDVNDNPDNPVIGTRSFGSDPALVAELGGAVATGLQDAGVVACAKHFPGHGDTDTDSHHTLPVVDHDVERLDAVELRPFRAAIDAGIDAIMTAHVAFPAVTGDPDLPATLSPTVLTGLLRETLGFEGLVVTDCMEMRAIADGVGSVDGAVRAIEAGADQVLVSHTPSVATAAIEAVTAAVRSGRLPESRIDASVRRVLRVKERRLTTTSPPVADTARRAVTETAERIGANAVTVHRDDDNLVPLPDRDVVVWSPRTDQKRGGDLLGTLADSLVDRGVTVRRHTGPATDLPPDNHAVVVAVTMDARTDADQAAAVHTMLDRTARVVVLAATNPYDLASIPSTVTALTTYDGSPALLAAAADVLAGAQDATGTLPIDLKDSGSSSASTSTPGGE